MSARNRPLCNGVSSFHIDFQKNLLCPKLTCQDHYYACKLATYGFGVHSGETGKGIVYVWPETIAPKNPDTLLSCLDFHLREIEGVNIKWNIFWADNTRSQNKNYTVALYFAHLVSSGVRSRIDYKFLISGHSYGDVDRDCGRAESIIRKKEIIETPEDYIELVNASAVSAKLTWIEMEQRRFKCFSEWLRTKFTDRRKDQAGRPFRFSDIVHFNYGIGERVDPTDGVLKTFSHPNVVWMRNTLDTLETPIEVDFRIDWKSPAILSTDTLAVESIIKLNGKKSKDLLRLTKFLSPRGKEYYENIMEFTESE